MNTYPPPLLVPGRGRLQPDRAQLPALAGTARRGRGRSGDLARSADAALHRPGGDAGPLPAFTGVAPVPDGRVGGRAELLPAHPPGGDATRPRPLRALDGPHLQ